jgi:hypothetical protein
MKWGWLIQWAKDTGTSDGTEVGQIRSKQTFDNEQTAQTNLEAHVNQPKVNGLPNGAYITEVYTEMRR